MMTVTRFDEICRSWVALFPELDGYVRVVNETHATTKLGDRRGIQLVGVIPSYNRSGNAAKPREGQTMLLWIVEKATIDANDMKELAQQQRTQDLIRKIEDLILQQQEDGCSDWWRLDVGSIMSDPEQNIFGGWNGWYMTFDF